MCKGCVESALSYIKEKQIDKEYVIYLDSNCLNDYNIFIYKDIKYNQLDNEDLIKRYGEFGNFILIDSLGNTTEFLTDMKLYDLIK
ncbi:MAG TPA: hypothetical protein DEG28_10820 [Porphyromonadaceae bacterium]|jgi:hypothetical protein|nr:hypothetical protein [Porphyromonadaceae bacterium]HBX46359.1 hypothetical protein [Porphyromonadaceae bacterium]